jgi:hypothetical protein
MPFLLAIAVAASLPNLPPENAAATLATMLSLYQDACLKSFPDDAALDSFMMSKGATALTPDQVKITLKDDPGRGWLLNDGDHQIQITLELPPFHACSVRRMTAKGITDMTPYNAIVRPLKAIGPSFVKQQPMNTKMGDLQIHATIESRVLSDGTTETLLVFDQRIADPERRANGENAVNIRFVRQLYKE